MLVSLPKSWTTKMDGKNTNSIYTMVKVFGNLSNYTFIEFLGKNIILKSIEE